jgi:sterol desaturase/sphingolipid hydroxylase (fatty acid hydroxylase superfamily)
VRISDLVRGGLLLTAAGGVLFLERRRHARPYRESRSVHAARNLAVAGIAAATVHVLETPIVVPIARAVARRRWGLTRVLRPPWLRIIVAVALLDYTLYIWHIIVHRVPWLWRFHLVHHVDLDLDTTTGLRFHAGELAASVPWRAAQVAIIGVTPTALTLWQSLTIASVLFHHSNVALTDRAERVLSWILATPRMHAIHHSVQLAQRHSNFSSGLSIWDRLHGTARFDATASDVTIGVSGYLSSSDVGLARILELPFEHQALEPAPSPPDV